MNYAFRTSPFIHAPKSATASASTPARLSVQDGYGYVLDGGVHRKIPQIGNVIFHDDVEIGANVSVDRGALGATIIGKGNEN